jgi:transposase
MSDDEDPLVRWSDEDGEDGAPSDDDAADILNWSRPLGASRERRGRPAGRQGGKLDTAVMDRIVYQYDILGLGIPTIARLNSTHDRALSVGPVYACIKRWKATHIVDFLPKKGRVRRMTPELESVLLAIVRQQPWLYLTEIAEILFVRTGVQFTREHVHSALHALKFSLNATWTTARGTGRRSGSASDRCSAGASSSLPMRRASTAARFGAGVAGAPEVSGSCRSSSCTVAN